MPTDRIDPPHFARAGSAEPLRYLVTVTAGPSRGAQAELDGTLIVGSAEGVDLRLEDSAVSRYHLELSTTPRGVRIHDLDSTNGTFSEQGVLHDVTVRSATLFVGQSVLSVQPWRPAPVEPLPRAPSFGNLAGSGEAMQTLFAQLARVARTDATVVLVGETGTGKETVARELHRLSARANGPFVSVDCGALSADRVEADLFGHVRGAFTGAVEDRPGLFESAQGGTLFLDACTELPLGVQPRLLRALETRTVRRLGASEATNVDARVIASSVRPLEDAVALGTMRADLQFRLAVLQLRLPPLRERTEDIPSLVEQLLAERGKPSSPLSPELLAQMVKHPWPGNIRELRNVLDRALLDPGNSSLRAPALDAPTHLSELLPYKEAKQRLVEDFTREYVLQVVAAADGNISAAARNAGISRVHLTELWQKYGGEG